MNAKTLIALSAAASLAAFAGCKKEQAQQTAPPQAAEAQPPPEGQAAPSQQQIAQIREMCPIVVEDTTVEVANMEGGVALVFTTQSGDVQDLRRRVRQTAAMYEIHGGKARVVWQPVRTGAGQEMIVGEIVPAVRAQAKDVQNGAAIMLMPQNPDDLPALRQQMAMHQQRLQGGSCWILEERAAKAPAAAQR